MDLDGLLAALGSADVAARRAAAEALLAEGAADAVIPLARACRDPDEQLRELANAALEDLGPPPLDTAPDLVELLDQTGPSAYWAATLLGRLEADAAPWAAPLGKAVAENSDLSVRQRAAWALAKIGPGAEAAIPNLEAACQDADPRLSRLAADALQKITSTT